MIPKSKWVWYGYAGHLCVSRRCAYHLCTKIGNRLVSTVGAYFPNDKMEFIGSNPEHYYETMVFECDGEDSGGNPNILSLNELERKRYTESLTAELGHRDTCYRIAEGQEDV